MHITGFYSTDATPAPHEDHSARSAAYETYAAKTTYKREIAGPYVLRHFQEFLKEVR